MEKLVRIYMMENKAIDFPLINSMDEFRSFLKNKLKEIKRFVKASNPLTILKKGFAIIKRDDSIITDASSIEIDSIIQIQFDKETVYSTVTKKKKNGK